MWPVDDCRYGHEQHVQQPQQHHQHRQSQQSSNFSHEAALCNGGYQDLGTSAAAAPDGGPEGSGLGALLSDAIGKMTPQVEVALEELLSSEVESRSSSGLGMSDPNDQCHRYCSTTSPTSIPHAQRRTESTSSDSSGGEFSFGSLDSAENTMRNSSVGQGNTELPQESPSIPAVKYFERRRKNNLAAKKSRDARRVRENQLKIKVLCLENANSLLRSQLAKEKEVVAELSEAVERLSEKLEEERQRENGVRGQEGGGGGAAILS